MLTRTVGLGVGSMNEFVAAMSPIAGISSQLGVNMNELGSGMAFITSKGETASAAGTQMQSIMSALLTPNTKMLKMYKKLGIESGQWAIKNFGLVGTLKKLKDAAGGSEQEMGEMLGRIEAVKGAMLLTGTGFVDFDKLFNTGLGGALESAIEVQQGSFAAKLGKVKNQITGLGIEIGQVLLPPLSQLVDWLSQSITTLNELHPSIIPVAAGFLAFGAALGPISGLIGGIKAALMGLFSPVGLLAGAIILIGGLAIHHFGGLDKLLIAASTSAQQLVQIVGYSLFGTLSKASTAAVQLGTIMRFYVGKAFEWVRDRIQEVITKLGSFMTEIGKAFNLVQQRSNLPGGKTLLEKLIPGFQNPFVTAMPSPMTSGSGTGTRSTGGRTPFASGGQGSGPINMITGERRPELVSFDGAGNWSVRQMNRERGGSSGANYTIYVMDRDLEARLESILERELQP
jgi:hypothetical protein